MARDTLILVAAIGFLGIAILLAVLFPPSAPASTQAITATARSQENAPDASPTSAVAVIATQLPATNAPQAAPPTQPIVEPNPPGGYPAPQPQVTQTLATPVTGTQAPPIFAPVVPTAAPTIIVPTSASTQPNTPTQALPTAERMTPTQPAPTNPPPPTEPAQAQPTRTTAPTAIREANDADGGTSPTSGPTAIPASVLRGNNYWTAAQSPYTINRDVVLAAGSSLIIEPGVEVRLAPGVSFYTEGKLYALGKPGQPVRFVGNSTQRWEGLFGRPGSDIVLEHTEIRGGGAGGTVIAVEGGALALRGTRINDNGGHVRVEDSRLEARDTEIAGNDMPYGAALDATYRVGSSVSLVNNRIGGNRMSTGAPPVQIRNESGFDTITVDIQRNILIGQDGPNLTLFASSSPFQGNIVCNALLNGANGLSIRSETLQKPGFPLNIRDNAIEDHVPPIVPIYLQYGIGRGATSEVELDMRNNWWGSEIGPYEPDRHADGRGDSVGENIAFDPWLPSWPGCAPRP